MPGLTKIGESVGEKVTDPQMASRQNIISLPMRQAKTNGWTRFYEDSDKKAPRFPS